MIDPQPVDMVLELFHADRLPTPVVLVLQLGDYCRLNASAGHWSGD